MRAHRPSAGWRCRFQRTARKLSAAAATRAARPAACARTAKRFLRHFQTWLVRGLFKGRQRLENCEIKQSRLLRFLIGLILEKTEQERDFFMLRRGVAAIQIPQQRPAAGSGLPVVLRSEEHTSE